MNPYLIAVIAFLTAISLTGGTLCYVYFRWVKEVPENKTLAQIMRNHDFNSIL